MSSLASESGSSIQSANEIGQTDFDIDLTSLIINSLEQKDQSSLFPTAAAPPGFNQHSSFGFLLNPNAPNFTNTKPTSPIPLLTSEESCNSSERKKLFVGNLPSNTSLVDVLELFRPYGRVNEQLSTVKDDNYAFVHFYTEREAASAQRALNDSYFRSRYIRVQYSTSRGHIKKSKTMDFRDTKQSSFPPLYQTPSDRNLVSAIQYSISSSNLFNAKPQPHYQSQINFPSGRYSCHANLSSLVSSKNYDNQSVQPRPITSTRNRPSFNQFASSQSMANYSSQSLLIPVDSELNRLNQLQQLIRLRIINEENKRLSAIKMACLEEEASKSNQFNLFGSHSSLFELESLLPSSVSNNDPAMQFF